MLLSGPMIITFQKNEICKTELPFILLPKPFMINEKQAGNFCRNSTCTF